MPDHFVLRGRLFDPIGDSTIEHEVYLHSALKRAGLFPLPEKKAGETHEEYALRLLNELLACGDLFPLLGGLLIPTGTASEQWTPELAAETAAHLKTVTDPGEKRTVRNLIVSLMLDFFSDGIASSLISPISSATSPEIRADDPAARLAGTANGASSSGS
jgi:hypothetical protein